jgi:hypothetical protein
MTLNHHASVRLANAPCTDDSDSSTMQKLPHKKGWEPAKVLAIPHVVVSLNDSAGLINQFLVSHSTKAQKKRICI